MAAQWPDDPVGGVSAGILIPEWYVMGLLLDEEQVVLC